MKNGYKFSYSIDGNNLKILEQPESIRGKGHICSYNEYQFYSGVFPAWTNGTIYLRGENRYSDFHIIEVPSENLGGTLNVMRKFQKKLEKDALIV